MIYVLIMSAVFADGMRTASVLHSQHDYSTTILRTMRANVHMESRGTKCWR